MTVWQAMAEREKSASLAELAPRSFTGLETLHDRGRFLLQNEPDRASVRPTVDSCIQSLLGNADCGPAAVKDTVTDSYSPILEIEQARSGRRTKHFV